MGVIKLLLQIISAIAGLGFIYMGLFLYEGEDKMIKNYFSDAWLKLDETANTITGRLDKIIIHFTKKLTGWIDMYYGQELLSFRAFLVSIFLSIISTITAIIIVDPPAANLHDVMDVIKIISFTFPLILVIAYYDFFFKQSRGSAFNHFPYVIIIVLSFLISGLSVLAFIAGMNKVTKLSQLGSLDYSIKPVIVLLLMLVTDFIYILLCRYIYLRLLSVKKLMPKLVLIALNVFFLIPVVLPIFFVKDKGLVIDDWGKILLLIPYSSIYTILLSSLHFIIILIYILNWGIWELVKRPVYSLQLRGFFEHKKTFLAVGIGLLALSTPQVAFLLTKYLKP